MIRVSSGGVTVMVGGELETFVADLVRRTETDTVRELREAAEEVRSSADREWYGRVRRRTGKTGEIGTTETVDVGRGEIRISVGSRDTRTGPKGGKAIPLYVHEPGRTATIEVPVDRERWMKASKSLRVPIAIVGGEPLYRIRVADPKAATGRYLVPLLITKPMRARVKALAEAIAKGAANGQ